MMGLRSANDDGVVILRRLFHSRLPLISAEVEWLTAIATADFIVRHEITHQVKAHAAAFPTFNGNTRGLKHGHGHDFNIRNYRAEDICISAIIIPELKIVREKSDARQ